MNSLNRDRERNISQKVGESLGKQVPKTEDIEKAMNSLNRDGEKKICEAVYGNKKCQKVAIMSVISNGELFNLCLDCAKNARLQIKLNK